MTTKLRALIVDDEDLARRGLEIRLQGEADIEICGQSRNGREAIAAVQELHPDIVFLDIQMPGMDGFETLRQFAGPSMPTVIFVTAFAEHAIRAFEENALDYLLKPIDDRRLSKAVQRVRNHFDRREAVEHRNRLLKHICDSTGEEITLDTALDRIEAGSGTRKGETSDSANLRRLAIKEGRTTTCVELTDIDWIESAGDYPCVHAAGQTHVLRGTMKRMQEILDQQDFARIHRSTIINMNRVKSMRSHINGEYFLTLEGDKEVKVSRSFRNSVDKIAGRASL